MSSNRSSPLNDQEFEQPPPAKKARSDSVVTLPREEPPTMIQKISGVPQDLSKPDFEFVDAVSVIDPVTNKKYFSPANFTSAENIPILLVKAPMGSGKTEALIKYLGLMDLQAKLLDEPLIPRLFVVPNRTLAHDFANRFEAVCYLDDSDKTHWNAATYPSFVVCVASLPRVDLSGYRFFIFDEFASTMALVTSSIIRNFETVIQAVLQCLFPPEPAGCRCILMDALLQGPSAQWLRDQLHIRVTTYTCLDWVPPVEQLPFRWVTFAPSLVDAIRQIVLDLDAGYHVGLSTNCKGFCTRLIALLAAGSPELMEMCDLKTNTRNFTWHFFGADQADEFESFLHKIETKELTFTEPTLIGTSPFLTAGANFTWPVRRVYLFESPELDDPGIALQRAGRFRQNLTQSLTVTVFPPSNVTLPNWTEWSTSVALQDEAWNTNIRKKFTEHNQGIQRYFEADCSITKILKGGYVQYLQSIWSRKKKTRENYPACFAAITQVNDPRIKVGWGPSIGATNPPRLSAKMLPTFIAELTDDDLFVEIHDGIKVKVASPCLAEATARSVFGVHRASPPEDLVLRPDFYSWWTNLPDKFKIENAVEATCLLNLAKQYGHAGGVAAPVHTNIPKAFLLALCHILDICKGPNGIHLSATELPVLHDLKIVARWDRLYPLCFSEEGKAAFLWAGIHFPSSMQAKGVTDGRQLCLVRACILKIYEKIGLVFQDQVICRPRLAGMMEELQEYGDCVQTSGKRMRYMISTCTRSYYHTWTQLVGRRLYERLYEIATSAPRGLFRSSEYEFAGREELKMGYERLLGEWRRHLATTIPTAIDPNSNLSTDWIRFSEFVRVDIQ